MTAAPLAILGAGGHAKVVIDIVERIGAYQIAGVFDDDTSRLGTDVLGHRVLGGIEEFLLGWKSRCPDVLIAIGNTLVRHDLYRRARQGTFRVATAVHPTAAVAREVELGHGTVIMAQAAVYPGCRIGLCAVVNISASVDHDCILGECVFIAPGAETCESVTSRLSGQARPSSRVGPSVGM